METSSAIHLLARYRRAQGRWPKLWRPATFNDHIVHRSLFDHDPRFAVLSDKIAVKQLIAERVGEAYVVPLLGSWDNLDAIDWDRLPEHFALKPSASSGPFAIVNRSGDFDLDALRHETRWWLKKRGSSVRARLEWGYLGVDEQLMAEPLLAAHTGDPADELDVFVFRGTVQLLRILTGRKFTPLRRDAWFDRDGRQVEVGMPKVRSMRMVLPDAVRNEAIMVAERIGAGYRHLRVDCYMTSAGLKIGEVTPYSWGGTARWHLDTLDALLGSWWTDPADGALLPDYVAGAVPADIGLWLATWQQAIRTRDYELARTLFAPDVMAFGSLAAMMMTRDQLEADQWRPIWEETRDFAFTDQHLVSDTGGVALMACRWSSEGTTAGCWYARSGRATLSLERRGGSVLCTHSHFSMDPGIPPLGNSV